jgi:hypothetical protein
MEYLNPLRVVFPQAQTANSDPVIAMSIRNFVGNMQSAFQAHKNDPNHMIFAPSPVGYQALGGEGKNLLVSQEIQQAEDSILLALGVSRELLSGTTNWNSTSIGLRMMQALLFNYTSRLDDFIDWSMKKVSSYLEIENIKVGLLPFRLVDDDGIKKFLSELAQAGKASYTSLYEEVGLDFAKERSLIREEAVEAAKDQIETQYEIEQAQFLAGRKKTDDMNDNGDYKTALEKAQDMASQLASTDEGTKRKFLNNLKVTDYGQYLMVSKLLEEYNSSAQHQEENAQNTANVAQDQVNGGNTSATPTAPTE